MQAGVAWHYKQYFSGRALASRTGQFVFEGRLELEALEGGVAPAAALTVGYRHHFKFK